MDDLVAELEGLIKAMKGKKGTDGELWMARGTNRLCATVDGSFCNDVAELTPDQAELLRQIWGER